MRILQDVTSACAHCRHTYRGSLMMVIPDGHVPEQCCKCDAMRTVHAEHRETKTGTSRW